MTASDPTGSGRPSRRQEDCKCAAAPRRALDMHPSLMTIEDVLDDRETETGTATLAAAFDIDTVEPLGEPRDCLARNTFPLVLDSDEDLSALTPASGFDAPEADAHGALLVSVFDRVVDKVLEHLGQ